MAVDQQSKGRAAARGLTAYFGSGWAFLLPYIVAYLLYAALRWPVCPPTRNMGEGLGLRPPSLLHLYWGLHAIHLLLAVAVCISRMASRADRSRAFAMAKWPRIIASSLLALLVCVPGLYLEWPSDAWEHLRRINSWAGQDLVTNHASWEKASYFLAYSLTGHLIGAHQVRWLNFYCAAATLLLCWQHYRLALALALSERAAFLFVAVNLVTFGNNAFSFSRYYGLSSSIFAQLAAIAIVRMCAVGVTRKASTGIVLPGSFWQHRKTGLLGNCIVMSFLLVFTAYNHTQGLAIAALAIPAVVFHWSIARYGYHAVAILLVLALVSSLACLTFMPRTDEIENLRASGWLNRWYGFDLLTPSSPAQVAVIQVLGVFGALNLAFGFWLCLRNNLAGWLTLLPWVALQLPFVGAPLAYLIGTRSGPENMLLIHRVFFAIPAGLATVVAAEQGVAMWRRFSERRNLTMATCPYFAAMLVTLALAMVAPTDRPWHNRLWHVFAAIPRDLELASMWDSEGSSTEQIIKSPQPKTILSTSPTGFILNSFGAHNLVEISRGYSTQNWSPTGDVIVGLRFLFAEKSPASVACFLLEPAAFYSSYSVAAYTSNHWFPQEAALSGVGTPELMDAANRLGLDANAAGDTPLGIIYLEMGSAKPTGQLPPP